MYTWWLPCHASVKACSGCQKLEPWLIYIQKNVCVQIGVYVSSHIDRCMHVYIDMYIRVSNVLGHLRRAWQGWPRLGRSPLRLAFDSRSRCRKLVSCTTSSHETGLLLQNSNKHRIGIYVSKRVWEIWKFHLMPLTATQERCEGFF